MSSNFASFSIHPQNEPKKKHDEAWNVPWDVNVKTAKRGKEEAKFTIFCVRQKWDSARRRRRRLPSERG